MMRHVPYGRPFLTPWLAVLLAWGASATVFAEDVTVTTYYPSPRGVYKQVRATDNVTVTPSTNYPITQGGSGPIGHLVINQQASAGADVGGQIAFGGWTSGTTNNEGFANIKGAKENATPNSAAGYLAFATHPAGVSALTERMRIDSVGHVGIGTTTPGEKLEVAGNIMLSNGGEIKASSSLGGAPTLIGLTSNSDLIIGSTTLANLNSIIFRNGAKRVVIDTKGNVGIGADPKATLHVNGTLLVTGSGAKGGFYSAASPLSGKPGFWIYAIDPKNANDVTAVTVIPPTAGQPGVSEVWYSTDGGANYTKAAGGATGLRVGPKGCGYIVTTSTTCFTYACEACGGGGCVSAYLNCDGTCGSASNRPPGFTCPTTPLQ